MLIGLKKENSVIVIKAISRRYPAEIITDGDYSDYEALLANAPAKAECQLHSLERARKDIDLYMNSDKTEFICFKQDGAMSILNGKPLKLVETSSNIHINTLFTKSDLNIGKTDCNWQVIDHLEI